MVSVKILIYDWRYIVASGINKILCELINNAEIKIATNEDDFFYMLNNQQVDIIFAQENKLNRFITKYSESLIADKKIVIIGKKTIQFPNLKIYANIPLAATKTFIANLINSLVKDRFFTSSKKSYEQEEQELTQREKQILKLIALGYTNQQIADELSISPHTVVTHRKNITKKLGIRTISGLTIYAILNNIISIDEQKNILPE